MAILEDGRVERVMGVFAHPDDPEFFCGASFARWAALGAEVTFVLATSGDKGSADPEMTGERLAALREDEERAAAAALGVTDVVFLRYLDGELEPTQDLRRAIVRMIRLRKPDIIVSTDPTTLFWGDRGVNHRDHRVIGEVVCDAVFPAARNPMYFTSLLHDEGLEPHRVRHIYLCGTTQPNVKIDVTAHLETKLLALHEHRTQIADMNAMDERQRGNRDPESPEYTRYTESFRVITFDR